MKRMTKVWGMLCLAGLLISLYLGVSFLVPKQGKIILTFGMFSGNLSDVPNDDCYKIIDENDKIIIYGNFNLVGDSLIDWNDTTLECSVFQNFASNDGGSYDVLKVTLAFYKDGKLIGTNDTVVTGDSFKDFSVNTTTKLPQKPDGFTFDIHTI